LTDFLQNADSPTLLHNSLRSNSARVGCDFAKNPMEFYHFVPLSFLCFYEYLKTFSYKVKNFQTEGCVC